MLPDYYEKLRYLSLVVRKKKKKKPHHVGLLRVEPCQRKADQ